MFVPESKRVHPGRALQQCVHGGAQRACSLAVNDSDFANAARRAFVEISGNEFFQIAGLKRVQIQLPGNRDSDGLCRGIFRCHGQLLYVSRSSPSPGNIFGGEGGFGAATGGVDGGGGGVEVAAGVSGAGVGGRIVLSVWTTGSANG